MPLDHAGRSCPAFVDDPEKFELTVFLTRIMFPYLACMSLMAAYAAILNSLGRFFAAAFAPVILNIVNIAALIPLVLSGAAKTRPRSPSGSPSPPWPAASPNWRWSIGPSAAPASCRAATAALRSRSAPLLGPRHSGDHCRRHHPDQYLRRHHHRLGRRQRHRLSSTMPTGSISCRWALSASPSAPCCCPNCRAISRAGREAEARATQGQSLLLAMLLSMPAATALVAIRGAHRAGAVRARRVRAGRHRRCRRRRWSPLPSACRPIVLIRVLQPGFFSRKDTKTPTIFAGISVVANIGLSLLLFPSLQHVGIALATSVSAWLNVAAAGGAAGPPRPFYPDRRAIGAARPDHR